MNDVYCPSCNSEKWHSLRSCKVCGEPTCDKCGVWVESSNSLICACCAAEQDNAIWQAMRPLCDEIYQLMGEDEEKVSPELFAAICECRTVDEVRQAFYEHSLVGGAGAKVVEMPRRDEKRRAA